MTISYLVLTLLLFGSAALLLLLCQQLRDE